MEEKTYSESVTILAANVNALAEMLAEQLAKLTGDNPDVVLARYGQLQKEHLALLQEKQNPKA